MVISVRIFGGFFKLAFAASTIFGICLMRLAAFSTFRSRGKLDCVRSRNAPSEMYSP